MTNLPPPNNDPNIPEEEPIPQQAPASLVGFAPQWICGKILKNHNGWLEEDDEEDPEEDNDEDPEEYEVDEDDEDDPEEDDDEDLDEDEVGNGEEEEMEIDDKMDNPEVIDPDEPPPPVYNTKIKIKKKFNEDDLRMNLHKLNVTIKYSKMKRFVEGLSKQINELKLQCSRAKRLSQWEAWVRPCIPERLRFQEEPPTPSAFAPRMDDPYVMARDASMATQKDDDDVVAVAKDPQPLESRGSLRDQTMPPKRRSRTNPRPTLTQDAADQLVQEGIEAAIKAERERVREEANRARGLVGGPAAAPVTRECTFTGFMKCVPRFVQLKKFEVEDELRHLKLRDMNIAAYTERFNELALLCPHVVPNEKKKVELYIKRLPEIIKGETTSSRPATLNEAVRMAHALMEQKIQAKNERIAKRIKRKWENKNQGGSNNRNNNNRNNRGNYHGNNRHNQYNQRRKDGARAMTAAQNNVADQGRPAPKCNRCGLFHFGNCPAKCTKCNKMGHKAKDCRVKGGATGVNALPIRACYECGDRNHDRSRCPNLPDRSGGNATGHAYALRDVEQGQGPNVVTVEFRIELVLGAAPVARAPYHLVPSELKELSDQLKELSEKGFIRLRSSPWGAPM
ncbi:putative reverse transcriptase domain-containing protein [Tanacetum coccineum]